VLLVHLQQLAVSELNWAAARVQIEPRHNNEQALVDAIGALCDEQQATLSRITHLLNLSREVIDQALSRLQVAWEEFSFSLGSTDTNIERNLAKLLFDTTKAAVKAGKQGFVLMLDEAQVITDDADRLGEHPLSMLIAAVNALQEKQVPIALVLGGLPSLKSNLLKARTYSERMFRGEDVDRLSKADSREALIKPLEGTGVHAAPELIEAVLDDVEGYPYFIQLWGAELWDEADIVGTDILTIPLLEGLRPVIFRRLDQDFYDPRVVSLRPAEQDLLLLTARSNYPPLRTADVRQLTQKKEANVNVLMGRLADQGVVYRVSKGVYEYTAPKFFEYLQRRATKSEWS